jgi:hypothetical protein
MFKNIMNYKPYNGEVNNQQSLTVPDQAMSIKEILSRFSRGLNVNGFTPIYDDVETTDDFLPDPRTLDLAERQEYAEIFRDEFNEIQKRKNSVAEPVGLTKPENDTE